MQRQTEKEYKIHYDSKNGKSLKLFLTNKRSNTLNNLNKCQQN